MTYNTNHLVSLMTRLSNEEARHGDNPKMETYLESIRREIKGEEAFLAQHGVETYSACDIGMTMDDIMLELGI